MGCWVSYGLGSMNENLPTFVVLPDHRGFASNGTKNWDSAFLPAQHQGTVIYPGTETPIADLFPARAGEFITRDGDEAGTRPARRSSTASTPPARPGDERLEARIRSYELAARMQLAAPEALDLSKEPAHVLKLYGLDHGKTSFDKEINPLEETDYFGRKCLVARRLLERGVRFVQIWSGNDNGFPRRNWDSHEDVQRDHGPLAIGMARGAAALIQDLKRARPARRHDHPLDDRVRPHAVVRRAARAATTTRTASRTGSCGGGIKGGISLRPERRVGLQAGRPQEPDARSTTSTPRSCTCSASTTRS